MSRCEASEPPTGKGQSKGGRLRRSFALTLAAGMFVPWFLAASCGGTQAPAPAALASASDAATDAGIVSSDDACGIQSSYVYQPIVGYEGYSTFDLAASPNPNPGGSGTNPSYISFDLTGFLYDCVDSPGCDPVLYAVNAGDAGMSLSASNCSTGFNAVAEFLPQGDPGHCLVDGGHATEGAHMKATGLSKWGMNLGIDLRQNCYGGATPVGVAAEGTSNIDASSYPNQPCYFDARGWTGISLWARLGSSDSVTNAIITIADPNTAGLLGGIYPFNDPDAAVCGDLPCSTVTTPPGPPTVHNAIQCDPFGKAITLTSDWQFYRIPFSDMVQKGYGLPEPGPDLAHFLGVKVNLSLGQLGSSDYDVWVNDIAFYK